MQAMVLDQMLTGWLATGKMTTEFQWLTSVVLIPRLPLRHCPPGQRPQERQKTRCPVKERNTPGTLRAQEMPFAVEMPHALRVAECCLVALGPVAVHIEYWGSPAWLKETTECYGPEGPESRGEYTRPDLPQAEPWPSPRRLRLLHSYLIQDLIIPRRRALPLSTPSQRAAQASGHTTTARALSLSSLKCLLGSWGCWSLSRSCIAFGSGSGMQTEGRVD